LQNDNEVALFIRFIDETWGTEKLSFFLECRVWVLTRCVSITFQHRDIDEYLTETFLTGAQVAELFHTPSSHTDAEIIENLTVSGWLCSDLARGDERE
jgi:hypothetical protein